MIEEFCENSQEKVNELDNGDNTMTKADSTAHSETKSMAEISVNDVEKVDVCNLFKQKIEMNLEDNVSLDDSEAYKAVVDDEYEQLDDRKATTADVNIFCQIFE